MCRVLEDVKGRHCGIAEAVHEDCLELAFEEVQGDGEAGEGLESRGFGRRIFVNVRSEEVDEGMYEERAGIFDYENGSPGNLGP